MPGAPKGNKNALKHGLYAKKVVAPAPLGAGIGDADWKSARATGEIVDLPSTALRSAPYADAQGRQGDSAQQSLLRAIRYLEAVMDELRERLSSAEGTEEFTRLANSLALAATALFNGHRTVAFLIGGLSPVEDALKELQALDFAED